MKERPEWLVELPKDFTDGGFKWAVDSSVMTVRDDVKKYVEGETSSRLLMALSFHRMLRL